MKVADNLGNQFDSMQELRDVYQIPRHVKLDRNDTDAVIIPQKYIQSMLVAAGDKKKRLKSINKRLSKYGNHVKDDEVIIKKSEYARMKLDYDKMKSDMETYQTYAESLDEDIIRLRDALNDLQAKNNALNAKLCGMTASRTSLENAVVIERLEQDAYAGEAIRVINAALRSYKQSIDSNRNARIYDVTQDLIAATNNMETNISIAAKKEDALRVVGSVKSFLDLDNLMGNLEFTKKSENSHIKYLWHGDERYNVVFAKTPSDVRAVNNTVHDALAKIYGN